MLRLIPCWKRLNLDMRLALPENHEVIFALYLIALTSGIGGAVVIVARSPVRGRCKRSMMALAPLATLVCLAKLIALALLAPQYHWNEVRLAPAFSVHFGLPLYRILEGPVSGHVCGPVAALAYLPSTWVGSPTAAVVLGAVIAALFSLSPVLLLVSRKTGGQPRERWLELALFCLFVLFSVYNPALKQALYIIHADAPALGLAALACGLFLAAPAEKPRLYFTAAALLASLSVWSKQNLAPVFLAVPFYFLLARGRRAALTSMGYLAVAGLLVSGAMVAAFGPFDTLVFSMFSIPSHHPFRVTTFVGALGILWSTIALAALPLAVCLAPLLVAPPPLNERSRVREFVRSNDWSLFLLVGLANIPTSFLGDIKFGGDVHTFSYVVYFVAIGALLALRRQIGEAASGALQRPAGVLLLVSLAIAVPLLLQDTFAFYRQPSDVRANPSQQAFDYATAHPGTAYFPWNPITGFLTDHTLYNCDWGVLDWDLAGAPLTIEEFRAGIPPGFRFLAYPPRVDSTIALDYLPEFSEETTLAELPGFHIFKRPGD